MSNYKSRFLAFLNENNLLVKGDRLLVAISGGSDSTFMLNLFLQVREEFNLDISLAYVNDMLRGEKSNAEELYIKSISELYGLKLHLLRKRVKEYISTDAKGKGLEEASRELRYIFFEELVAKHEFNKVATGHTADDNVETFMFRLMRGSMLSGLGGIPIKRDYIIRPILCFWRDEVLDYLKTKNISYLEDESNSSLAFTRNKIRHQLIPCIENDFNLKFKEHVNNLVSEIGSLQKQLNLSKLFSEYIINDRLLIHKFSELDIKERKRIIAKYLELNNIKLSSGKIEKIAELSIKGGAGYFYLGQGKVLKKSYSELTIIAEENFNEKKELYTEPSILKIGFNAKFGDYYIKSELLTELEIKNLKKSSSLSVDKSTVYLDADKLKFDYFIVRSIKVGDRFIPSGSIKEKRLSRLFIDLKIDKFVRNTIPILVNGDDIVWVAGVRGSECFKVDDKTERVIKISVVDAV